MIKKEYKLVFMKFIKFVVILLIIDFVFGSISRQVFFNQKTGKYARSTHVIYEANPDILIFGSSHAHRHYIPKVFEEKLQKKCYNAGAEGQQLLYHNALQKMVFKRSTPKLIILNIDENFLYKSKVAYDRLSDLHPYYEDYKSELRPVLELNSKLVDFKLFFKSYQTNSTIIHALRYYLSPQIDYKGYRPLFDKMKSSDNVSSNKEDLAKEYIEEIDENFVMAFKEFIANAKSNNVDLIFVTSPTLNKVDFSTNESLNMMKEIAKKEKVPLIDFFNSEQFIHKYELFHDPSHLNNDGSTLFTASIAEFIKNQTN